MGTEKEDPSFTSDVIEAFGQSQVRFEKCGHNFNDQLDNWADEYAEDFKELGIQYPKDGPITEKCRALISVFVKNRLEGGKLVVDTHIARLKIHGILHSIDKRHIDEFEQRLNAEKIKSPQFRPLIAEVLAKIEELRKLL